MKAALFRDPKFSIWIYVVSLRKLELLHNQWHENNSIIDKARWLLALRRHNRLGQRLGVEMSDNSADAGLLIWHANGIVINGNSRIGKNLTIHGQCCIGNNGKTAECPVIGNDVDVGVGASIIGPVKIPNHTVIGAGAVVINSFQEEGLTIAGIPAKVVRKGNAK